MEEVRLQELSCPEEAWKLSGHLPISVDQQGEQ